MFFGEQHWQLRPNLAEMQRENDSVLSEQSSDLIAELRATPDHITLAIRDDGIGFVLTEKEERRGLGIELVRAMSRQLGGEFIINSPPAGGTCATISFPSKTGDRHANVHV
jgi:two-component sensor histidine kinase